jgi:lysozyme
MDNNVTVTNEPLNAIIDLSHFNQVSDFATIKAAGILGVIHKATQGTHYTDPEYANRRNAALDAGLLWGAYHFADASDGAEQADHFLSTVNPEPGDLLVLDMEQNYSAGQPIPSMNIADAETFVQQIEQQSGRFPGLYSGSYIKQLLGDKKNRTLANCWFWLAEYGQKAVTPANWPYWTMWQYTDGNNGPEPHSVNGVGACDRDKFNGDIDQLLRLWGIEHPSAL